MKKADLRRIYLAKRRELSPAQVRAGSERIAQRFFEGVDLAGARYLHTYLPLAKFNEVDTTLIIEGVWAAFPNVAVVVPRMDPANGELENRIYRPDTPLVENRWGISEPADEKVIRPELIDVVIVPALVFNLSGHRVGYGKGYYDRFLAKCSPVCRKIGLSFFDPIERIDDIHAGDVAIDACITPDTRTELGGRRNAH